MLQILTHNGFKKFDDLINQGISQDLYQIFYDKTKSIKATGNHKFMLYDGSFKEVKELNKNDILYGDYLIDKIEIIENENVYDFYNVEDVHSYYTNDLISHNCNLVYLDEFAFVPFNIQEEFFRSTMPTITSRKYYQDDYNIHPKWYG